MYTSNSMVQKMENTHLDLSKMLFELHFAEVRAFACESMDATGRTWYQYGDYPYCCDVLIEWKATRTEESWELTCTKFQCRDYTVIEHPKRDDDMDRSLLSMFNWKDPTLELLEEFRQTQADLIWPEDMAHPHQRSGLVVHSSSPYDSPWLCI